MWRLQHLNNWCLRPTSKGLAHFTPKSLGVLLGDGWRREDQPSHKDFIVHVLGCFHLLRSELACLPVLGLLGGTTDWWLKQHRLIFSQFWKPQTQVSAGLVPSDDHEGRICSRPLSLDVDGPSSCSHGIFLPWVDVSKFPCKENCKVTSQIGLEPTLMTSFKLNYLFRDYFQLQLHSMLY